MLTDGIPLVTTLGPVFTSSLDDRAEWFLSKFVHNIELRLQVIMHEDKAAIQVVFSNLEDKSERNLKFSMDKCKVCTWHRINLCDSTGWELSS